jgi:hypothetical protein
MRGFGRRRAPFGVWGLGFGVSLLQPPQPLQPLQLLQPLPAGRLKDLNEKPISFADLVRGEAKQKKPTRSAPFLVWRFMFSKPLNQLQRFKLLNVKSIS